MPIFYDLTLPIAHKRLADKMLMNMDTRPAVVQIQTPVMSSERKEVQIINVHLKPLKR